MDDGDAPRLQPQAERAFREPPQPPLGPRVRYPGHVLQELGHGEEGGLVLLLVLVLLLLLLFLFRHRRRSCCFRGGCFLPSLPFFVHPPPQRHRGLVVVPAHADPPGGHRELQRAYRVGALVHQVPDEDEQVAFSVFAFAFSVSAAAARFVTPRGPIMQLVEELPELLRAAVDVTDDDDAPSGGPGLGGRVEDGVDDGGERRAFFFFFERVEMSCSSSCISFSRFFYFFFLL